MAEKNITEDTARELPIDPGPDLSDLEARITDLGRIVQELKQKESVCKGILVNTLELMEEAAVGIDSDDTTEAGAHEVTLTGESSASGSYEDTCELAGFSEEADIERRIKVKISDLLSENQRLRRELGKYRLSESVSDSEGISPEHLSEYAPTGMALVSDSGTFDYVNTRFVSLFGYDIGEVPPLNDWLGLEPAELPDGTGSAAGDAVSARSLSMKRKDGTEVSVQAKAVKLASGQYLLMLDDEHKSRPVLPDFSGAISFVRSLLDAVSDGALITDISGEHTEVSRTLLRMLELPPEVVETGLGPMVLEMLADRLKDPEGFRRIISEVTGKPDAHAFELLELKDGRIFSCNSVPLGDTDSPIGRIWLFRETSDYVYGDRLPQDSETLLRMLWQNETLAIISCDSNGRISSVNPAGSRMLGFGPDYEDKEINLFECSPFSDTGLSGSICKCADTGEPFSAEITLEEGAAGPKTVCWLSMAPVLNEENTPTGVCVLLEDITSRKRAEESILGFERMRLLGEMSNGLTHSISNLFQVVSGNANMAMTSLELEDYEEIRSNLEQILEATRSGTDVVRRIQQFSRERSSTETARREVFDLADAVTEGIELCKLWAKARPDLNRAHVEQEINIAPGCFMVGDKEQIGWVVLNLLRNAVEALPEGGRIQIDSELDDDRIKLLVRDNGPGIPNEVVKNITKPFWTTKESHAGMGLAVNSRIIREHRGTMGVKRLKPHGSIFTIKLPRAQTPQRIAKVEKRAEPDRSFRILLIDDEPAVVTILGKSLSKKGNTTFTAKSGEEGLSLLKDNEVDVVVCDLGMEGMNGWDVGREIRDHCRLKGTEKPPFILLTGWGGQLSGEELQTHPYVDRIVEKPVTVPTILDVIGQEVRKAELGMN